VRVRDYGYGQVPFGMEMATGLGRMHDIEMMERVRQLANVAGMMAQETQLARGFVDVGMRVLETLLEHIVGSSWVVQETLLVNSGHNSWVVRVKLRESTADSWSEAQEKLLESIARSWPVAPARLRDTDRGIVLAAALARALYTGHIAVVVLGTLLYENHSVVLEALERQLGRLAGAAWAVLASARECESRVLRALAISRAKWAGA
jgi:hypothetical protein